MGMCIEAVAKTIYTIYLEDEDIEKVKTWIEQHEDELPSFDMKNNIAWAVECLYNEGEISLYDGRKASETDSYTEKLRWSEFEDRKPEEILGIE